MIRQHTNRAAFLTVVLSVILIGCLISWELIVPFALPIISRHIELLLLLFGWGMAAVSLFKIRKDLPNSKEYSAKEIKWFILWLVTFTVLNAILYFVRLNLFSDPDIKDVLWEQRLYFLNVILSFLPWTFALLGAKAIVFEKAVNCVAAVTQILYFVQCVCIGSWYMPLGNKNRIDILYAGLITFPLVSYCLCAGRFTKKTDRLLAGINIALCLLLACVGTSRQAFMSMVLELMAVSIILWRRKKAYGDHPTQIRKVVSAMLAGIVLTLFIVAMNIFDARGNVVRSLSWEIPDNELLLNDSDPKTMERMIDLEYSSFTDRIAKNEINASLKSPPVLNDLVREYWRMHAIENNLESPIITSGRLSYSYISPAGEEFRSGAHNVFIDYWSLFGLVGLVWIGVFGGYLFVAQFYIQQKGQSTERRLAGACTMLAEAVSFGFALTQCVYLQPFTFAFLIMAAAWCRAMNKECAENSRE